MLASYLIRPGVLELREVPTPSPARGEVLLKIKAALTCGTDLKAFLRGHPMIPMPGVFGHEFSGIVAAVGEGVQGFREGDEVMAVHSGPCLVCPYCRKGLYNLCEKIMETKVLGGFAEYILLPQHIVQQNLFPKPATIGFDEAAFLEPLACVVHGMNSLPATKGDKVLIMGTGPIGLLHLMLTKKKGAEVMITGRKRERLEAAAQLGADRVVRTDELTSAVREFTNGLGVDSVIECTGQLEVWESSIQYLRRGGTVLLFGGVKGGTSARFDTYRLHYDEITLRGSFHFSPSDVKTAYDLLKETIDVTPLISGRYPLAELPKALENLSEGKGLKYAIIP
ncbi:MAG: zinc-binding dehydrogenase [Nitrospirales bacterium]|nr:zinc-binding dehydrogenase [Nitrospirales bacterium]